MNLYELVRLCEPWNDYTDTRYFTNSLDRGRIDVLLDSRGLPIAYVETWRITHDLVRKIETGQFDSLEEDITHGEILWIANVGVDPTYRHRTDLLQDLKRHTFIKNRDALWIGWKRARLAGDKERIVVKPFRRIYGNIKAENYY